MDARPRASAAALAARRRAHRRDADHGAGSSGADRKAALKAKIDASGTVGKAPVGYLNVRKLENGREARTVGVDGERAPLVQWAFDAYAHGEWTLISLTDALRERGLTSPATAKRIEKPLTKSSIHRMLRNRYYVGKVTWQGIEYDGAHPPLIDEEVFNQVQDVLDAHNRAGEKQREHPHYLKGSVWCGTCGSRLCITKTTNRHGTRYEYFFCVGRHQRRTSCTQSVVPIERVETHVEQKWRNIRLDPEYAKLLRDLLFQEIDKRQNSAQREGSAARRRVQALKEQRKKLLDAHYANAIPLDLLKAEQDRIAADLKAAERILAATQMTFAMIKGALERCLTFLTDCHTAYIEAPARVRRLMNQAVFERISVGNDETVTAELNGVFGMLLATDLVTDRRGRAQPASAGVHRDQDWREGIPAALYKIVRRLALRRRPASSQPRPTFAGLG